MQIDLNYCFPIDKEGKRGPLPKQKEFLSQLLSEGGSKYVLYCGGVGSGKTLIGCIATVCMAVLYPGDYLIARQFYPELKITTLKTFLEICPKELIKEYRVADGIVKIKATGGKISNVIFRQLEEPDKLRSLNLSGFYIDESSQVSEAAFMLLQGRLRGPGLRKGILTTNPNGHDWQYRWFVKQDLFKKEDTKRLFSLIRAPSTENVHLPEGYVENMLQTWSAERIKREIDGSFDAFEGMVYHEFRQDVHVVEPFVVPQEWTRIAGCDHGYRNPAAWVFGAVDYDGNIYVYDEFYEKEWLIEEICLGNRKLNKPGILQKLGKDKLTEARMDPSTRAVRGAQGKSDWDFYIDNLPVTFPLMLANNDKTAGIDRVKSFLKVSPITKKPKLFIFRTCTNLIEEFSKYRYAEMSANSQGKKNDKEEPMKVDDHLMDSIRYMIMTQPEPPKVENDVWKKIEYNSLEGSLYRELKKIKHPAVRDPFEIG